MATYALFISVTDLKQTGYVDENVDDGVVRNVIRTAQEMYIKEALGTALYDALVTGVTNNTLVSPYTTLMASYVKPTLVWYSMYEGVLPFSLKIRNKGVMQQTSENAQTLGIQDLNKLMDFLLDRAETYRDRMTKYLQENATSSTFSEYLNPGTGVDTIHPDKQSFTSPWVLNRATNRNVDDWYKLDNPCE